MSVIDALPNWMVVMPDDSADTTPAPTVLAQLLMDEEEAAAAAMSRCPRNWTTTPVNDAGDLICINDWIVPVDLRFGCPGD